MSEKLIELLLLLLVLLLFILLLALVLVLELGLFALCAFSLSLNCVVLIDCTWLRSLFASSKSWEFDCSIECKSVVKFSTRVSQDLMCSATWLTTVSLLIP